jgi:hypothetical protein
MGQLGPSSMSEPGIGPYPSGRKQYELPQQDRVMPEDWRKIFDNYEDGSFKPGYPFTGIFGSEKAPFYGKCATCMKPMYLVQEAGELVCSGCGKRKNINQMNILEQPNLTNAPRQRRQLAISDPKDQKLQPNPDMQSGSPREFAWNEPTVDPLGRDVSYPSLAGEN